MYRVLVASSCLLMLGCPDYIPFDDSNLKKNVEISNFDVEVQNGTFLSRNGNFWIKVSPDYDDTTSIENSKPYKITELTIHGKQKYDGMIFDTIDILEISKQSIADGLYLIDNSYSIVDDSITLMFKQSNGIDSSFNQIGYKIN